jgi:hypothetical protein
MKNLITLSIFLLGAQHWASSQASCLTSVEIINDPVVNTQYCLTNAPVTNGTLDNSNCFPGAQNEGGYDFTIASGPQTIQLDVSNYSSSGGPNQRDIAFEVFSGACGSLTSLGCVDVTGSGGAETLNLPNLANGTYFIAVYSTINGTIPTMDVCVTALPNPPINDDCINAIPVTVGTNGICTEVTGTNTGASASTGVPAPSCGGYAGGDVWYSITVPASGEVNFTVDFAAANSITDADMAIYSGVCGSLTEIECDDLDGTGVMPIIQATGLTAGTTVYIRIWEFGNDVAGDFDLCVAEPPVILNNQDCATSIPICGGTTFAGASSGSGSVVDLNFNNEDCLAGENQSSWVHFEISSPGDIEFAISPQNGTDDYDFALWVYPGGVGQSCPPANNDVDRCSFAAGSGLGGSFDTGLGMGEVDLSESAAGNNWVAPLTGLNIGDVVYLVVDNFSSTTSPYTLDFGGSTAGLDCTILPTELMTFYAQTLNNTANQLFWKTNAEINNDYFTVEHSYDAENWRVLGTVTGAGNSTSIEKYSFVHEGIDAAVNYYRIYQTDFDGETGSYRTISIDNSYSGKILMYTTNLLGQKVDANYSGMVVDVMNDGTIEKRFQE